VVHLSHALIDGGTTGRLLGGTAARPRLSAPVAIGSRQGQTDHMLFRLPDGELHLSAVSAPPGSTGPADEAVLAAPLPEAPGAHGGSPLDVLWRHYTSGGPPPVRAKVVAVEPRGTDEVAIEAIDEVDAYYAAATSDLSVDLPRLTRAVPAVVRIDVSETLVAAAGGSAVELTAALTVEGDWRGGTVTARLDDGPTRVVGRLDAQDLDATWLTATSGTVTVRAVPGSAAAPAGRALEVVHRIAGPGEPDGVAGAAGAISTTFASTLSAAAAAPTATGAIRVTDGSDAISPLVPSAAEGATTLEVGLSAGDDAGTKSLRGFLTQVAVHDVASVYENRTVDWIDFAVTSVPASIPDGAGTASFGIAHIESPAAAEVSGACFLGFSRARDGVDGRGVEYVFTSSQSSRKLPGILGGTAVDEAGTGYAVGDRASFPGGVGGTARVTDVDGSGGIRAMELTGRGRGYAEDSIAELTSANGSGAVVRGVGTLPQAAWPYDDPGLAAGVSRGGLTYFDGTPGDLSEARPYLVRFRRAVPGQPAPGADIGEVPWEAGQSGQGRGTRGSGGSGGSEGRRRRADRLPGHARHVRRQRAGNARGRRGDRHGLLLEQRLGVAEARPQPAHAPALAVLDDERGGPRAGRCLGGGRAGRDDFRPPVLLHPAG